MELLVLVLSAASLFEPATTSKSKYILVTVHNGSGCGQQSEAIENYYQSTDSCLCGNDYGDYYSASTTPGKQQACYRWNKWTCNSTHACWGAYIDAACSTKIAKWEDDAACYPLACTPLQSVINWRVDPDRKKTTSTQRTCGIEASSFTYKHYSAEGCTDAKLMSTDYVMMNRCHQLGVKAQKKQYSCDWDYGSNAHAPTVNLTYDACTELSHGSSSGRKDGLGYYNLVHTTSQDTSTISHAPAIPTSGACMTFSIVGVIRPIISAFVFTLTTA